jgi:glucokinase
VSVAVVGLDLGGTKIAAAVKRGQELGETELQPTCQSSTQELIDQLVEIVKAVKPEPLDAVGIGVPSVVEFDTGRVVSSVNVPLAEVSLREVLGERLGVPVFVDNDATVAALAEAHDEELRLVARNLVMITVGTGIGGGLVLGGRIYRGSTGGAGELGHAVVAMDARSRVPKPNGFPTPGSLEYVASGNALDRLAEYGAREDPDSGLGALAAAAKPVTGVEAVRAAQEGDAAALKMVEIWAERVGVGVANAINTFDPDEVVIGGGAARAGELLLEPARRVAVQYVVPGLGKNTTIRLARHGVRAGVLGAALLAEHELQGRRERSEKPGPDALHRQPPITEVPS